MQITAINGSPRGAKGNTHVLVEHFLKGAADEGATCREVFLHQCLIEECRDCLGCWLKTPGKCVIEDDMNDLIDEFMASDIVVFATPVYVDNVTGLMKIFLDRLIPIVEPLFEKDPQGIYRHRARYEKYPKLVIVSNCGFPEQVHFEPLRLFFGRVARNMHTEVIGEIYRGGGELLKVEQDFVQETLKSYFEQVRQAGREIIKEGKILKETAEELEKPIIPVEHYILAANSSFERKMK